MSSGFWDSLSLAVLGLSTLAPAPRKPCSWFPPASGWAPLPLRGSWVATLRRHRKGVIGTRGSKRTAAFGGISERPDLRRRCFLSEKVAGNGLEAADVPDSVGDVEALGANGGAGGAGAAGVRG